MKHLLEIAKELHKAQQLLKISGSVALNLHGIKTRREPEDLDIFIPFGKDLPILEGMEFIQDSETYAESNFRRTSYTYKGVRIDFFSPEAYIEYNAPVTEAFYDFDWDEMIYPFSGIPTIQPKEIIAFKVSHALDLKSEDKKHAEDIIYILQNNGRGNNPKI